MRSTEWTGYKVQPIETRDETFPQFVTDVATAPPTTVAHAVTAEVQRRLAARDLAPTEHRTDTTDVTAEHLVSRQREHTCTVVGPASRGDSWQARAETGDAVAPFAIDWEARQATCPGGKARRIWKVSRDSADNDVISLRFDPKDGPPCLARDRCLDHDRARIPLVRTRERFAGSMSARERLTTDDFEARYANALASKGPSLKAFGVVTRSAHATLVWRKTR